MEKSKDICMERYLKVKRMFRINIDAEEDNQFSALK